MEQHVVLLLKWPKIKVEMYTPSDISGKIETFMLGWTWLFTLGIVTISPLPECRDYQTNESPCPGYGGELQYIARRTDKTYF